MDHPNQVAVLVFQRLDHKWKALTLTFIYEKYITDSSFTRQNNKSNPVMLNLNLQTKIILIPFDFPENENVQPTYQTMYIQQCNGSFQAS